MGPEEEPETGPEVDSEVEAEGGEFANQVKTNFKVEVLQPKVGGPASGFNKGAYGLEMVVDFTKPVATALADLTAQSKKFFIEMLGVPFNPAAPNLKKGDLVDIAKLVIKKNTDVGTLP